MVASNGPSNEQPVKLFLPAVMLMPITEVFVALSPYWKLRLTNEHPVPDMTVSPVVAVVTEFVILDLPPVVRKGPQPMTCA